MAKIGSEEKPFVMSTGTIASEKSRFRKGFNKATYDENYDRIFSKDPLSNRLQSEFEIARETSKTFESDQD
jgi:hypothetical protein|tara:strand:- start:3146 stop:3358 length:213 start_codon:yes stop_codon:yes gene_type:complete